MLPTLQQAIETIKSGDKITGRSMLADIIQADLENETAWLWMSSVVDTDAEKRRCLERVLAINPDNKNAQRGLAMLGPKDPAPPLPEPSPPASISDRLAATGAVAAAKDELYPIPTAKPIVENSPPPEPAGESEQVDSPETPDEIVDEEDDDDIPMPGPGGDEPDKIDDTQLTGESGAVAIEDDEPDEADLDEEDNEDSDEEDDTPKLFWRTEQGKLLIAAGLVVIVLVCIACFVGTFVFRPLSVQVSSTVDAALGSPTPTVTVTATGTPLPTGTPTATPTSTVTPSPTSTSVVADTPTPTPTNTRPATPDRTAQSGQVVSVISGDVIEVVINGESQLVKYISIDTPALNDPQLGTEPFGPEALQINQLLVSGQFVRLEKDVTNTDDQGRLLRHVFVGDMHINEELLRQGVARTNLIPPDLKYGARLQEVEQAAQAAGIGIWSIK